MHKEKEREMVGERVRNIRRNVLIVVAKSQLKKEGKGERDSEREVKLAKKIAEKEGERQIYREKDLWERIEDGRQHKMYNTRSYFHVILSISDSIFETHKFLLYWNINR